MLLSFLLICVFAFINCLFLPPLFWMLLFGWYIVIVGQIHGVSGTECRLYYNENGTMYWEASIPKSDDNFYSSESADPIFLDGNRDLYTYEYLTSSGGDHTSIPLNSEFVSLSWCWFCLYLLFSSRIFFWPPISIPEIPYSEQHIPRHCYCVVWWCEIYKVAANLVYLGTSTF